MSKCKYWTTKNIKQVLDENYNRGVNGKDYEELVPELQEVLWARQDRQAEKELKKYEKELLEYEEMMLDIKPVFL